MLDGVKNDENLIFLFMLVLISLTGCTKPEVNYDELFTPPSASIAQNQLIIKAGSSNKASACYVIPYAKIKDNKIYVYGTLTLVTSLSKDNIEKKIQLPKYKNTWEIYWVNRDGSLIKIKNNL